MSTGDMTQYMRVKQAERAHPGESSFMRDGFDAWAESNQPARVGQMEKEPAPETSLDSRSFSKVSNMGTILPKEGAMTVGAARHYRKKMHGGGVWEDLPDSLKEFWTKVIDGAKAVQKFYLEVTPILDEFMDELTTIEEDEDARPELRKFATELLQYLNKLNEYRRAIDTLAGGWNAIRPYIGMGSGMHGGAEGDTSWWVQLSETVADFINWIIKHKTNFKEIFQETKALNRAPLEGVGKKIASIFSTFLGAGRHGGKKHAKLQMHPCNCSSGSKRRGKGMDEVSTMPYMENEGGFFTHSSPITSISSPKGKGRVLPRPSRPTRPGPLPGLSTTPLRPMPVAPSDEHNAMMNMGSARVPALRRFHQSPMNVTEMSAGRKKRAPSARGAIVKKVMHEKGLSLPQASKYVKEHGLY